MTGIVTLTVNGIPYAGWTDCAVNVAMDTGSGQFTLQVSEPWASGGPGAVAPMWQAWPIKPGDECQVAYNGLPVMTGVVDNYQPSYDAESHGVQIDGRSKTRDPIDSSAKLKPGNEAKKVDLKQLATKLLANYDVGVEVEGDFSTIFERAAVMDGESVHEMLERYVRQEGGFATDTPEGNLRIVQVEDGGPVATLVEGGNIKAARANLSADKKHSDITVKGQEPGTDQKHGEKVAGVTSTAQDPSVKRHRPLVLVDENAAPKETQKKRADWEHATRGGESVNATITVVGWTTSEFGGKIWWPGDIVAVRSPMLRINRNLAIKSINFTQNDQTGTLAELSLVPPEALNPKTGQSKSGGAGKSASKAKAGATKTPAGGKADPAPPPGGNADWWIFTKPNEGAA